MLKLSYHWIVSTAAKYLTSCEEAKMLNPLIPKKEMFIDIDDSGRLEPFPVNCVFDSKFQILLKFSAMLCKVIFIF